MPWTSWLIIALIFLAADTLMRWIRFRHDPKPWTLPAAATGALLWGVAWIVLSLALHYSLAIALLQAALFDALYIAIVVLLGRRFLSAQ